MRRVAFVLAALASWAILLLWAARIDVQAPFAPMQQRGFSGAEFGAVFGTARADGSRLSVLTPGADYTSLQSTRPADIDAEKFPTLRYRLEGFPRTLELSLIFRTADKPEDDIAISLPWPGDAQCTFDLSRIPEWRGRIVELGFAQFPTAQIVPPAQGFKPFAIVDAALWSRSWQGDLAALATDWFGAWPWTQRSVHALGRDTDTPRARPLVVCVALAAGIALAWIAIVFGWRNRNAVVGAAIACALGWLALDVVWQRGLWGRLQTTRAVYGDLSWSDRERTIADTDIAAKADALRVMLRDEPEESRILIHTDAERGYELLRFVWHMLPRNVALFGYAYPYLDQIPDGCLIVFLDSDLWRTDAAYRQLLAHSEHLATPASIHGDGFDESPVVVFRFHRGH